MRTTKTCLLSLLLALFALPAFADDALISEIIRLDEERRAQVKRLHVEYDVVQKVGDKTLYEFRGNIWEKNGKDKCRYRIKRQYYGFDEDENKARILVLDVSADSSVKYVFRAPPEGFPIKAAPSLSNSKEYMNYVIQGYEARIVKNPTYIWPESDHPFITLDLPSIEYTSPSTSYKDLFEKAAPKRVEKIKNEAGDDVVQVEFVGEKGENTSWDGWTVTIDFNLSKGGLFSKKTSSFIYADDAYPTSRGETIVTKFEECRKGHWYPQEVQTSRYDGEDKLISRKTTTITEFTLNKKSKNQLGPVQFPENSLVEETDANKITQRTTHIWGKKKSHKHFTDDRELAKYMGQYYSIGPYAHEEPPKSVLPIRFSLLVLGALFVATGIYLRRLKKKRQQSDSV